MNAGYILEVELARLLMDWMCGGQNRGRMAPKFLAFSHRSILADMLNRQPSITSLKLKGYDVQIVLSIWRWQMETR